MTFVREPDRTRDWISTRADRKDHWHDALAEGADRMTPGTGHTLLRTVVTRRAARRPIERQSAMGACRRMARRATNRCMP